MKIRKTQADDIKRVIEIYDEARAYMRANGNMHQWADGYPERKDIENDIKNSVSYVVTDESYNIICTFAFLKGPDPTYKKIYDGEWPNDEDYCVIHRIAVSEHKKGIATFVFNECMKKCSNLRVDTHRDNIPMQNALIKNGFRYCGIIYLLSGDERLAYQKRKNNENT